MNHWLLCLPREDIENCIARGTFGLGRKYILGSVSKGDCVVCCAGKGDWKVIAFGTVTSNYYVDDEPLFLKPGHFPDRFDFSAEKLQPDQEIDLMSVIDRLEFVKSLAYWAVFFRNGIVKISPTDWNEIVNATKKKKSKAMN